jgi:hypothetical protein
VLVPVVASSPRTGVPGSCRRGVASVRWSKQTTCFAVQAICIAHALTDPEVPRCAVEAPSLVPRLGQGSYRHLGGATNLTFFERVSLLEYKYLFIKLKQRNEILLKNYCAITNSICTWLTMSKSWAKSGVSSRDQYCVTLSVTARKDSVPAPRVPCAGSLQNSSDRKGYSEG